MGGNSEKIAPFFRLTKRQLLVIATAQFQR